MAERILWSPLAVRTARRAGSIIAPMLRMRLRRVGAKKQPKYRVVIAESRAPRDGAFVETIGFYVPLTEPSTVHIDRDKALTWLSRGAQPSDTVVRLLRTAGITPAEESVRGAADGGGRDAE